MQSSKNKTLMHFHVYFLFSGKRYWKPQEFRTYETNHVLDQYNSRSDTRMKFLR